MTTTTKLEGFKIMENEETLEQMNKRFAKERELEFKRNKENIYFRLSGYDKYYNANQCWDFTQYILENGFTRYKPSDIESIYFDTHNITIRLHSTAETDIKRFKNSKELLNFVIGWNSCLMVNKFSDKVYALRNK
tara:strand:+ start:514 stop:918 length:405 start_codon:yes stop_codon:yes gene_type:complete